MANKFAKDFENNTNRDFGSFAQKENVKRVSETKAVGASEESSSGSPNFSTAKVSETKIGEKKVTEKTENKPSHGEQNEQQLKPARVAKKGRRAAGAANAVRRIAGSTVSTVKGTAAAAAAGVTKVGALVGGALHVSTAVGTALVLSGFVAAAAIPTAGIVGYGVSHSIQQKDGCVPEEYDGEEQSLPIDPSLFYSEDTYVGQALAEVNPAIGDQDNREVNYSKYTNYNSGSWTYVIRTDDNAIKVLMADAMIKACDNDNIGYAFSNSTSCYYEAEKVGWDPSKITVKCSTQCSYIIDVCLRAGNISEEYAPADANSTQIWDCVKDSGKFTQIDPPASVTDLQVGDILVYNKSNPAPGETLGHVAMIVKSPNRIKGGSVSRNPSSSGHLDSNQAVRHAAVLWGRAVAENNDFHYGKQPWCAAMGCYFCNTNQPESSSKAKNGGSYEQREKTYVCQTFVTACYRHGGRVGDISCKNYKYNSSTGKGSIGTGDSPAGNKAYLENSPNWQYMGHIPYSELVEGDVIMTSGHVKLYCGNGEIVHARTSDNGVRGSSSWNDSIIIQKFTSSNYNSGNKVWRYVGGSAGVDLSMTDEFPMFANADYNDIVAEMTADDGCGGEMDGSTNSSAYIGQGMKKITAANGEEYIILDFDLDAVKTLGRQGDKQCYIYSIGYCDLILGGKFRCSIEGSANTKHSNMRSSYGSGAGENGDPGKIGGVQGNVESTDAMRKLAIEEIKQGRPVIFYIAGNSYGVSTEQHWICICGWTANAGSDPSWDDLVCCDPAYLPDWGPAGSDGLHSLKGFSDHGTHVVTTFEGWKPASGQTKRK